MDIIELILSNYTDFIKFEALANEIMIQEGYNNLIPAGGIKDDGVDAHLVKYFENSEYNIIFQYSLQKDVKSKIKSTYEKIKELEKKCDELIIVTLERINNKEELKNKFRKDFGIRPRLEIYERQVFHSRIGANRHLLHRFFPNIKKQIESDLFNKITSNDDKQKNYEKSLAKISIALTQSDSFFESHERMFDSLILHFIYANPHCTVQTVQDEIEKEMKVITTINKIEGAIKRLIKNNKVQIDEKNKISISNNESIKIEEVNARVLSEKSAVFDDILFKIQILLGRHLSEASKSIAIKNTEESITDYFKLYALEKTFEAERNYDYCDSSDSLIAKLKQGLIEEESDALIYCVGELLKQPSQEQKSTLISWCKTYVGTQVLKLDPKQIEFQGKEFQEKNFILDTDFVLNMIVNEVEESKIYRRIISKIIEFKSNILIPIQVLDEVSKHAKYSYRSYHYFNNKSNVLDAIVLEEQIANVFTKGYFARKKTDEVNESFDEYIKNYYYQDDPINFLKDMIKNEINSNISYIELADTKLEDDEYYLFEKLQEKVYKLTINSIKGSYRDEEENREIAKIDARIYINYRHKNRIDANDNHSKLKYKYYIITTSYKILRCAKELNIFEPFYVRPLNIISLLERVAPFDLSYDEITNLFENPFLNYVVSENWDFVKKLIGIGLDLRGFNLTRLKYELSDVFKSKLFEMEETNNYNSKQYEDELLSDFIKTSTEISKKGYHFIPSVQKLIDNYKTIENDKILMEQRVKELEHTIGKFGKRKQKYLKKMAKNVKN